MVTSALTTTMAPLLLSRPCVSSRGETPTVHPHQGAAVYVMMKTSKMDPVRPQRSTTTTTTISKAPPQDRRA